MSKKNEGQFIVSEIDRQIKIDNGALVDNMKIWIEKNMLDL